MFCEKFHKIFRISSFSAINGASHVPFLMDFCVKVDLSEVRVECLLGGLRGLDIMRISKIFNRKWYETPFSIEIFANFAAYEARRFS
jgi:hypothetical protein